MLLVNILTSVELQPSQTYKIMKHNRNYNTMSKDNLLQSKERLIKLNRSGRRPAWLNRELYGINLLLENK